MKTVSNIKVSIIIPVYGVEHWIRKCAESAFSQQYDNIEFIFVNDATKDNSIDILHNVIDEYPLLKTKIKIINHKDNKGLAKARETGIQQASGDFIYHLDSDDWIEKDTIKLLISQVTKDVDIVAGGFRHIWTNEIVEELSNFPKNPRVAALEMMKRNLRWNTVNKLIKRTLYTGLDIPSINNGEDYVTTSRLYYKATKICYVPIITYNYNHLNESSFQKRANSGTSISDVY